MTDLQAELVDAYKLVEAKEKEKAEALESQRLQFEARSIRESVLDATQKALEDARDSPLFDFEESPKKKKPVSSRFKSDDISEVVQRPLRLNRSVTYLNTSRVD